MRGFFITGTDTGVGKTLVSGGILRLLRDSGIDAGYIKPIQTGANTRNGQLYSQDLSRVSKISGMYIDKKDRAILSPYLYKTACSPHLAAKIDSTHISVRELAEKCSQVGNIYECVLIEGAGGIMVPINEKEIILDFIKVLNLPVILVSRSSLGTINHTLLSIRALRDMDVDIAGVVVNDTKNIKGEQMIIRKDNVSTISRLGDVKILADIRYSQIYDGSFWKQIKNSSIFLELFSNLERQEGQKK